MNNTLRNAIEKFARGDALTDAELDALFKHYTALDNLLSAGGEAEYRLVLRDVWRKVQRLGEMKEARRGR